MLPRLGIGAIGDIRAIRDEKVRGRKTLLSNMSLGKPEITGSKKFEEYG